jgi:hypothetical protein
MSRSYNAIDLQQNPNPFTVNQIPNKFQSNELLLTDHKMRIQARVAVQDIGQIEGTRFTSPMHLQPGWKWK